MDNSKCSSQKEFIFYLLPEFTLLAVSSAIEALRLANYTLGYPLYTWRIVSLNGQKVTASCGLSLESGTSIHDENKRSIYAPQTFMVIVCGGLNVENYYTSELGAWLRKCRQNGLAIASLCTGTHILAKAGLLSNKKCVIHWENIPSFMEQFSNSVVDAQLIAIDGGVHTCAGGMAAFDMMLHIIRHDCDESIVMRICEQAIVDKVRKIDDKQRLPFSVNELNHHPSVKKLIEKMEKTIAEPMPLGELMADLELTRRQIERHFRAEMKVSPARYYMMLRLERARLLLLHMNMPIIEIAIASGFSSASHFSKTYRDIYKCSPLDTRKAKNLQEKPRI